MEFGRLQTSRSQDVGALERMYALEAPTPADFGYHDFTSTTAKMAVISAKPAAKVAAPKMALHIANDFLGIRSILPGSVQTYSFARLLAAADSGAL
jgi:hypothetical protein